jgi:hypothetical protein
VKISPARFEPVASCTQARLGLAWAGVCRARLLRVVLAGVWAVLEAALRVVRAGVRTGGAMSWTGGATSSSSSFTAEVTMLKSASGGSAWRCGTFSGVRPNGRPCGTSEKPGLLLSFCGL